MRDWKNIFVGDLGKIITGKTPKTSNFEYYGGNIPFLTPSDDMKVKHIKETKKALTDLGKSTVKNLCLPKNSVCISCIGSDLGKVVITTQETVSNQQINSIIVNENLFDVDFVYYSMLVLGEKLKHLAHTSTAIPIINKSTFSNFTIFCPPLELQKKIAAILSSLDDKIELNNQINKNLEQQAQAIFKSWFNSTKNGYLSDLCQYSKEKISISELTLNNYYSTENILPNKAGVNVATNLPKIIKTTKCNIGDILVSNIRPYFKKIAYCHNEGGCSNDVLCFTPYKREMSPYIFNILYEDNFFDFMMTGSKGTKMPRGDKQQIMTYSIYIPDSIEVKNFNNIAEPILEQIKINTSENVKLSLMRDLLLPKLISGKIDVSNVDI